MSLPSIARPGPARFQAAIWAEEPRSFTLGLLDEALRSTQDIAARIVLQERDQASEPSVIDAALALGRLTGLTGQDEIFWIRACLAACGLLVRPSE